MKAFTVYEFAELVSCGDLQRFALPRALLVANLVVDDLSVLSVGWRRLPSHHDALQIFDIISISLYIHMHDALLAFYLIEITYREKSLYIILGA